MQNYIQPGKNISVAAAPYVLASGAGCLVGSMFGVASGPAASGAEVVLMTEGVFTLPKLGTDAFTVGAPAFWDDANKRLTLTASGNTRVGVAVAAAGSGLGALAVRLNGSF